MTNRGVSTVVSYVLILGIVAIVASSLVGAFAPFVINQQQSTVHSTLEVIGNNLAADIQSTDRLVHKADSNGSITFRTRLPDRVGGQPYEIEVAQQNPPKTEYKLSLRAQDIDTRVVVHLQTETPVEQRTGAKALHGGALRITYDNDADALVIQNV